MTQPADPLQVRFVEALARRMADQPAAVQRVLQARLDAAAARAVRDMGPALRPQGTQVTTSGATDEGLALLAGLNAQLRRSAAERSASAVPGEPGDPEELANARRFRRAWASGRTLDQLQQAVAKAPANAGPLNSHALVLRTLERMGALSTDYLRRFLVHAEALQWLEQAAPRGGRPAAKKAKAPAPARARARKR
jgi:hypothetical protein